MRLPWPVVAVTLSGFSDPAAIRAIRTVADFWGVGIQPDGAAGLIFGPEAPPGPPDDSRPRLVFSAANPGIESDRGRHVTFARRRGIPAQLQGSRLLIGETVFSAALTGMPGWESGASIDGRPVWLVPATGDQISFLVATPPPRLAEGQHLSEILNGETFLHALPVWLFFRSLAPSRWTPPPLRACLIVDDPNLHRPGYGHIDYQQLIDFARSQPFHAAMATVPLDGWWVDQPTARLFRENAGALSLLVHGNDHLHYELARTLSSEQQRALVRQSLARTATVDRKAGFEVDRVMAPPHGVCSPELMELLWREGFEGLTTNRWSLWKHSPAAALPADSGFRPADWLAGGLPVVPRFRFKSAIGRNEIVLAALFGQPIVPYGHHQDFTHDMAAVRETVATVNALGPVRWMSMRGMLESNFEQSIDGQTLRVRLFSRRVRGTLPAGLHRLRVEPAPAAPNREDPIAVEWCSAGSSGRMERRLGETFDLPPGSGFAISLPAIPSPGGTTTLPANPRLRVLLRRLASEARDRLRL